MKHLELSVLSLLRTDNRINGICLSRKDPIIYVQSKCRHIALSPSTSGRGDFEHNQTANWLVWQSSCPVQSVVVVVSSSSVSSSSVAAACSSSSSSSNSSDGGAITRRPKGMGGTVYTPLASVCP